MTEEKTLAEMKEKTLKKSYGGGWLPMPEILSSSELGPGPKEALMETMQTICDELKAIRKLLENITTPFEMYGPGSPEED